MMSVETKTITISTPDGEMPAFLCVPNKSQPQPGILLFMEAFGLTQHIKDIALRIAQEGYIVITADLYYRELPNNKFGYAQVEQARAMMFRLDFHKTMEEDIQAVLTYLKSRTDVQPDRIGVTGFCFGGSMAFYAATRYSSEIAVAASFYGVVIDEWLEAVSKITIPIYLFFGGVDPFIKSDRIQQIESRLQELNLEYKLKVYPDADHGFFCHERSSYNQLAAEDSWQELTQFFRQYLL